MEDKRRGVLLCVPPRCAAAMPRLRGGPGSRAAGAGSSTGHLLAVNQRQEEQLCVCWPSCFNQTPVVVAATVERLGQQRRCVLSVA